MSWVRAAKDRLRAAFPRGAVAYLQLKEQAHRLASGGRHLDRIFSGIHANNLWGERESVSGPGSSLAETAAIRAGLPVLLREIGARTLIDAPCGDCFWITQADLDLDHYLGVDIVPELIARNQERYGAADRAFAVRDLTCDPLPRADAILCRDCWIHFSYHYIWRALDNFRRSGARHLLVTTYRGLPANRDILTGQWRPLDLELPPFRFPSPLQRLHEKDCIVDGHRLERGLGLWRLRDLPGGGTAC
jgi:hypothetical protein